MKTDVKEISSKEENSKEENKQTVTKPAKREDSYVPVSYTHLHVYPTSSSPTVPKNNSKPLFTTM